ncbi:MAG TPA: DUF2513 domain-containing protein [Rhodoferax sp.]|nr:DUF2513 domain-containing protein [Rhodoferax sp.]
MKRDFDLIRKILIDVAAEKPGTPIRGFNCEGKYDAATICKHVTVMINAGLLTGAVSENPDTGIPAFVVDELTASGHDFLDAAIDNTVWVKAKKYVIEPVGEVGIGVLLAYLKVQAMTKPALSSIPERS